jgi:F-type H+-transporting ATPase subunit gamma
MPSLKEYRVRIESVKSTRKITSAMKMVAASKLRRAQEQAEAAQPYAMRMERMISALAEGMQAGVSVPRLMSGTGAEQKQLVIVITSDRGLCGGFNGSIVREARRRIAALLGAGREVSIICVGRKGRDLLRRDFSKQIVASYDSAPKKRPSFAEARVIADTVLSRFDAGTADVVTLFYNRFKSVIAQVPTEQQMIPFRHTKPLAHDVAQSVYEYEPAEETILAELLPRNLAVQIYRALLDSAAGEQGARMAAMDNATRNASDMINKLTLTYNRVRQAYITKELIEIISGAEAL